MPLWKEPLVPLWKEPLVPFPPGWFIASLVAESEDSRSGDVTVLIDADAPV